MLLRRRTSDMLQILGFICLSSLLIYYSRPYRRELDPSGVLPESVITDTPDPIGSGKPPKLIMVWNSFFGSTFGQEMMGGCPTYNCKVTSDKKDFELSEAVIFHAYAGGGDFQQEYAKLRQPWQRFIYFVQESPVHASIDPDSSSNRNFYNWTYTFRRDSDIPSPYGYTVKLTKPVKQELDIDAVIRRKMYLAAWFVSNCGAPSQRLPYVKKLQEFMSVHIYGACGNYSCPKTGDDKCLQKLSQDYKFYFAFENSICKDYITEKFWSLGAYFVIPVVLKRSVVEPFAPPHSFIAVDDFKSPREMADYLHKLDENADLYAKYFEWRTKYRIVYLNGTAHDINERPWGFCLICKRLWEEPTVHSSYYDFHEWWVEEAKCSSDVITAQLNQTSSPAIAVQKSVKS